MYHTRMFSLSTSLARTAMRFLVRLWFTYGALRWTGVSDEVKQLRWSSPDLYNSLLYREIYYFAEPSEGTVSFLLHSGKESISLI